MAGTTMTVASLIIMWLLALIPRCDSSVGVSLSKRLDQEGWKELLATIPDVVAFASVHVQFYNGSINPHAVPTLEATRNTSIESLSVHMHPCLSNSVYSKSRNLICASPREQLHSVLNELLANSMDFVRHPSLRANYTAHPTWKPTAGPTTPTTMPTIAPTVKPATTPNPSCRPTSAPTASPTITPTTSPSPAPTCQPSAAPTVGLGSVLYLERLFVCIEDEVPNRFLASEHGDNLRYLLELVKEASSLGVQVGIYTTRNDWMNSVADRENNRLVYHTSNTTTSEVNPLAHLPLWTPRFDSVNSMDFYAPFGDWSGVLIKQVSGGTTALHRIGSDRVELNYMDDTLAAVYAEEELREIVVV